MTPTHYHRAYYGLVWRDVPADTYALPAHYHPHPRREDYDYRRRPTGLQRKWAYTYCDVPYTTTTFTTCRRFYSPCLPDVEGRTETPHTTTCFLLRAGHRGGSTPGGGENVYTGGRQWRTDARGLWRFA